VIATYVLLLTLIIDGKPKQFMMDHSLTIEDCARRIVENSEIAKTGTLRCEKMTKID